MYTEELLVTAGRKNKRNWRNTVKLSSLMDPRLIYLDYHFDSYHQIIDFVAEKISLTTSLSTGTIKESLLKGEYRHHVSG